MGVRSSGRNHRLVDGAERLIASLQMLRNGSPQSRGERYGPLARFASKIVGVRHYEGADAAAGRRIRLRREPENPHDANAIAVFNHRGVQVGYLPREEAAWLAPLLDAGAIRIGGVAGKKSDDYTLEATLIVRAPRGSADALAARDPGDTCEALLHNFVVGLWEQRARHSHLTIFETLNALRDALSGREPSPRTQLLLRMVEGDLLRRTREANRACRSLVGRFFQSLRMGPPAGWAELAIAPLFTREVASVTSDAAINLKPWGAPKDGMLTEIGDRCPYVEGARGFVVFVQKTPLAVHWFECAAYARANWLPALLHAWKNELYPLSPAMSAWTTDPDAELQLIAETLSGPRAQYDLWPLVPPGVPRVARLRVDALEGEAWLLNDEVMRFLLPRENSGVFVPKREEAP